ncbi:predicted protein [Streptomyces viridosporus ATCC 14672]|uniref:Predicted protein n=1 Tax=Streptomyces viridosporus (strain ATCC 14672 / DSM 40746 / JCM 4963 / KCTC 9882 / NRRL B-12104 / FH 1290) TaxID=566461 RepID=D5ZWU8_STRV1|nr:predicted protein [Streptomyces viridosporus ATCC 14672]
MVAGERDRRRSRGAQPGDGLGAGGLGRVGDLQDRPGLAVPGDRDRGAARASAPVLARQAGRQVHDPLGRQPRAAHQDRVTLDDAYPRPVHDARE